MNTAQTCSDCAELVQSSHCHFGVSFWKKLSPELVLKGSSALICGCVLYIPWIYIYTVQLRDKKFKCWASARFLAAFKLLLNDPMYVLKVTSPLWQKNMQPCLLVDRHPGCLNIYRALVSLTVRLYSIITLIEFQINEYVAHYSKDGYFMVHMF